MLVEITIVVVVGQLVALCVAKTPGQFVFAAFLCPLALVFGCLMVWVDERLEADPDFGSLDTWFDEVPSKRVSRWKDAPYWEDQP